MVAVLLLLLLLLNFGSILISKIDLGALFFQLGFILPLSLQKQEDSIPVVPIYLPSRDPNDEVLFTDEDVEDVRSVW